MDPKKLSIPATHQHLRNIHISTGGQISTETSPTDYSSPAFPTRYSDGRMPTHLVNALEK